MDTPSLWSKLCAWCPVADDLPLFDFWLARSSGCALDIHIIAPSSTGNPAATSITLEILTSLMQVASRWRKMALHLGPDMESFFTLVPRQVLPSLQELDLNLSDWSPNGTRTIAQFFASSPQLHTVEWGDLCLKAPLLAETSWATVTTLSLGCITFSDLYQALPQLTSIRTLVLNDIEGTDIEEPLKLSESRATVVELPHLHRLSCGRYNNITPIFDCLSIPCLSEIVLKSGMGIDAPHVWTGPDAFARLVERSRCRLTSLEWKHYSLPQLWLAQFLVQASTEIMPHLEHLEITSLVSNDLVESLVLRNGGPFPLLESFDFPNCRAHRATLDALLDSRPNLFTLNLEE